MSQTEVQLIKDAVIVNADVSNSAAIDVSKLSGVMPLAGGTFTNDVTFTGANANIVFDKSADSLEFGDNTELKVGTDGDFVINHNGSHTFLSQNGTGDLFIRQFGTSNSIILGGASSEKFAQFTHNGSVEIYHDNSKKFETQSGGAKVIGLLTVDGNLISHSASNNSLGLTGHRWNDLFIANDIDILDNGKLLLGTGDDLQIYHDGSNSYIDDTGTGNIYIRGDSTLFIRSANNEDKAKFTTNGSVELYHDNSKKFETTSTGGKLTSSATTNGSIVFDVLSGIRGYVYADNANNIGFLDSDADWLVKGTKDAGVELHFNGSKKFETLSDGVDITGTLKVNGSAFSGGISNIVEDTSPQLGGNLDTNGNNINVSEAEKITFAASSGAGPEITNTGSSSRDLKINIDNAHKYTLHQNGILYQLGANSGAGGAYSAVAASYPVRAFLNFDDEDNVVHSKGNVSSVTDTATGKFTINWASNFPDTNYAVTATSGGNGGSRGDDTCITFDATDHAVGSIGVRCRNFQSSQFVNSENTGFIAVR